jgi:hypothetical protein
MTEAEIYRAAAQQLRDDGWWHGGNSRCPTSRATCIGIAIASVTKELVSYVSYNHEYPHLHDIIGDSMAIFNDAPDMTADDAIAALEIAADLAS